MKTLWHTLVACCTALLAFAGFAGLAYRTFDDGGWMATLAERGALYGLAHPYATTLGGFLALGLFVTLRRGAACERVSFVLVYALMATGAYFIGHLLLYGVP